MPSLVPHPETGEPIWDYDLPDPKTEKKAAKKAASSTAKSEE